MTDGVTAGTTTITSATAAFGTDVVGNLIYVSGGTGSITAGWYQIVTRTNSTTITVDRSTGLSAGTGVTLHIGGALASPGQAGAIMVSGNDLWIKSGTYSITSASLNVSGGCLNPPGNASTANTTVVSGYQTTRGDNGARPTLQASGISTFTLIDIQNNGTLVYNLILDGASLTSSRGARNNSGGNQGQLYNVKVLNCTNGGIVFTGSGITGAAFVCEVTGCSTVAAISSNNNAFCFGCWAHDNTITGFSGVIVTYCISSNNTGASSDGIVLAGTQQAINCTCYKNGRDGIRASIGNNIQTAINCLSTDNTGSGFNASGSADLFVVVNPVTYNNGTAINANVLRSTGAIALSSSPFVNAASNNFALNSTSGAGASCRAAGIPGVFPGGLTTGYLDIGAAQHPDAVGGVSRSRTQ